MDALLTTHLDALSITPEDFAEACQKARHTGRDVNKQVFEQLTAMDDFLTFKKLMVKRNMCVGPIAPVSTPSLTLPPPACPVCPGSLN